MRKLSGSRPAGVNKEKREKRENGTREEEKGQKDSEQ